MIESILNRFSKKKNIEFCRKYFFPQFLNKSNNFFPNIYF